MDITGTVKELKMRFTTLYPEKLAEKLDAIVIQADLPDNTRGFFQLFKRIIVIYINNKLQTIEQRNVLAHELAHAILHRNMNRIFLDSRTLNVPNRYENEANLLAAHMIISDEDIKEYLICNYTISNISDITGIKKEFVEKRMNCYVSNLTKFKKERL